MNDSDHTMSRAEYEDIVNQPTAFWYDGDHRTIVSFTARAEGISLALTCFELDGDPQMSTMITWEEFARIAEDMPSMTNEGARFRRPRTPTGPSARARSGGTE